MAFRLFTSNYLEVLANRLADRIAEEPLSSPFDPEIIVVQSRGMERWLSMQLARHLGISANIRFPFPNKFLFDLTREAFPELPETSIFEPGIMTWRLMTILPELADDPRFEVIKNYLSGPDSELKCLQLSERLADLFDQYLLFRPEMIKKWQTGSEIKESHERWQAWLWRKLSHGQKDSHRAALGTALLKKLTGGTIRNLPQRVSIFGISSLPPFYLQVFDKLATTREVNIFLLEPCKHYWADIVPAKRVRHLTRSQTLESAGQQSLYFDEGNKLLASLGQVGQDFFYLIHGFDVVESDRDDFVEPRQDNLLHMLQKDILNLRNGSDEIEKKDLSRDQKSLLIQSCHSPRREIEILQDNLLAMFNADVDLKPGDILVMAPNIDPYTSYIQAVFDLPPEDARWMPFSIADRSYAHDNEIIDTLLEILDLCNSRFTVTDVLGILDKASVHRRFELDEDDLEMIYHWVRDTRINWGVDAEQKQEFGLPAFPQNTWRAGLQRMLLGYALPGKDSHLYKHDLLPYDNIEGHAAVVFGKFLSFLDNLFAKRTLLTTSHSLAKWSELLGDVLNTFFDATGDNFRILQTIRYFLLDTTEISQLSGHTDKINVQTIRHYLRTRLYKEGYGYGFLTGGVTFCSMLPMRSIPFKVICLIGMNVDAYPRMVTNLSFDLIATRKRKRGDRSRRYDDKYLFLETLLSARETLYISYLGQSIKDNASIPPSVIVSELLDYLDAYYKLPGETSAGNG